MTDNQQMSSLNDEGRDQWEQKAEFWDNLHGDAGNLFHRELIGPVVEQLLRINPGEHILDIACGNGVMARRMAALGGRVTAVDFSEALIERARARGQESGESIQYAVVDATDEAALVALGEGKYDAITCLMALMDMPQIAPLYRAARRLLRPEGRFVFAAAHPAFNSNNPVFVAEMADKDGELIQTFALKFTAYLDVPPVRAVGAPGEPNPHNYYHRPLHRLLRDAFDAGFVLDALEEPAFTGSHENRLLSWLSFTQFPPVMAGRMRVGSI